jgi:type II secretory pathway component PulL
MFTSRRTNTRSGSWDRWHLVILFVILVLSALHTHLTITFNDQFEIFPLKVAKDSFAHAPKVRVCTASESSFVV